MTRESLLRALPFFLFSNVHSTTSYSFDNILRSFLRSNVREDRIFIVFFDCFIIVEKVIVDVSQDI